MAPGRYSAPPDVVTGIVVCDFCQKPVEQIFYEWKKRLIITGRHQTFEDAENCRKIRGFVHGVTSGAKP